MASLTSIDLQTRLALTPRGWQFKDADNRHDLNWLMTRVALTPRGGSMREVQTRIVSWEFAAIATNFANLADRKMAAWRTRLLDSGLHLWIDRTSDRGDVFLVVMLASGIGGALPVDFEPNWQGDSFADPTSNLWGIRLFCSTAAMGLFANELGDELQVFPVRSVPRAKRSKSLHQGVDSV